MMPDFFQTPRFQLPDDWSPDGTACVVFRVPNDQQYFSQIIGLVDALKWSRNFARDETNTGAATVSRTWQAALESEPVIFQGCDMPEFRINPETCLLEVDCSGEGDWQPVWTPAFNPSMDAPVDPPYPDPPPEGQDNRCLAAANTTAMLQNGATNFANLLDIDSFLGAIVGILYTFLSSVVTVTLSQLWLGLGVAYGAFDAETILDDLAAFDWDVLECLLYAYYQDDGTMTALDWATVLDIMQDYVTDTGDQIWLFIAMIWGLMGTVGAAYATRWAGIEEADCSECGEHIYTWSFEGDDALPYDTFQSHLSTREAHDGTHSIEADMTFGSPNPANYDDFACVRVELPAGETVTEIDFWAFVYTYYSQATVIRATHKDSSDVTLNEIIVNEVIVPDNDWYHMAEDSLSWLISPGDYIEFVCYASYAFFANNSTIHHNIDQIIIRTTG